MNDDLEGGIRFKTIYILQGTFGKMAKFGISMAQLLECHKNLAFLYEIAILWHTLPILAPPGNPAVTPRTSSECW